MATQRSKIRILGKGSEKGSGEGRSKKGSEKGSGEGF